jgi:hypothetical protein
MHRHIQKQNTGQFIVVLQKDKIMKYIIIATLILLTTSCCHRGSTIEQRFITEERAEPVYRCYANALFKVYFGQDKFIMYKLFDENNLPIVCEGRTILNFDEK